MQKSLVSAAVWALLQFATSSNAMADCIAFFDRGGYWVARNSCSSTVTVRWTDEGACRTGCAARVGGQREQTITAPRGRYRWREED
jgi:hypothetical protein